MEFKGSYAEWEDWKERRTKAEAEARKNAKPELKKEAKPAEKPTVKAIPNEQLKALQHAKSEFKKLEEKLTAINEKKQKLEAALADPQIYNDKVKFLEAEQAYKNATAELNNVNATYERLFEQIMELEGQ